MDSFVALISCQIDKLQSSFHQWERLPAGTGEQARLAKELLTSCESIEWQVHPIVLPIFVSFFGLLLCNLQER